MSFKEPLVWCGDAHLYPSAGKTEVEGLWVQGQPRYIVRLYLKRAPPTTSKRGEENCLSGYFSILNWINLWAYACHWVELHMNFIFLPFLFLRQSLTVCSLYSESSCTTFQMLGLQVCTTPGCESSFALNFFFLFSFSRQGLTVLLWLSWNLLGRMGWPRTPRYPPASASQMQGLKGCDITPGSVLCFSHHIHEISIT